MTIAIVTSSKARRCEEKQTACVVAVHVHVMLCTRTAQRRFAALTRLHEFGAVILHFKTRSHALAVSGCDISTPHTVLYCTVYKYCAMQVCVGF